jgi:polar amino acid transport system substrate-binding protein
MRFLTRLLLMLCVTLPGLSHADAFRVANDEWERYTAPDGSGFYFDVLRQAFAGEGHTASFEIVPFERAKGNLLKGSIDVMPGVYAGDLPDAHVERRLAIEVDALDIFYLPATIPVWRGLDSLAGLRVAARNDYNLDRFLPKTVRYEEYPKVSGMLRMLAHGRVDAVLDYVFEVENAFEDGTPRLDLVMQHKVLSIPTYVAFADTPRGRKAREVFVRRMRWMLEHQTLGELYHKYSIEPSRVPRFMDAP